MRNVRGFSMIEMLISTAIFMVISAGVLALVSNTHRSYANEQVNNDAAWQGRAAVDLMVRELRMAGYPAGNTYGAAGLTPGNSNLVAATFITAGPTDAVFESDLDGNGIVERVEYRLNGTTLERSAVSKNSDGSVPAAQYQALAENVNNGGAAIFTYRTDPFSTLPAPGNVNVVEIMLPLKTARPDPKNGQYRTLSFGGMAYRQNPER